MSTRYSDELSEYTANENEHYILRLWHTSVVISNLGNSHPATFFLYNEQLGKIVAFPSGDQEYPRLGQWIRCKVLRCETIQNKLKRNYCQYKLDQRNWCTIQPPYPTFIGKVGRSKQIVISVPVLIVKHGFVECEFIGPVSGILYDTTKSVLITRCRKGEKLDWSVYDLPRSRLRIAPHTPNKGTKKFNTYSDSDEDGFADAEDNFGSSSSSHFHTQENSCNSLDASYCSTAIEGTTHSPTKTSFNIDSSDDWFPETPPMSVHVAHCHEESTTRLLGVEATNKAHNSATVSIRDSPQSGSDAVKESSHHQEDMVVYQEMYVGVVIQKRQSSCANLGSMIVIFAQKIGIIIGMPSVNGYFPQLGDWIKFAIEYAWVPEGDRISPHQLDNLRWSLVTASFPTYSNDGKCEIVIEVPVDVNEQGNLFSDFTGEIEEKCVYSNSGKVVALLTITECEGDFNWRICDDEISSLSLISPCEEAMTEYLNNLRSLGSVVQRRVEAVSESNNWHPSDMKLIIDIAVKEEDLNTDQIYMGIVIHIVKYDRPSYRASYLLFIYNYLLGNVVMRYGRDDPHPDIGQWIEFRATFCGDGPCQTFVDGSFWRIVKPPVPTFFMSKRQGVEVVLEIPIKMREDGFAESLFTRGRIVGQNLLPRHATKAFVLITRTNDLSLRWTIFQRPKRILKPVPYQMLDRAD